MTMIYHFASVVSKLNSNRYKQKTSIHTADDNTAVHIKICTSKNFHLVNNSSTANSIFTTKAFHPKYDLLLTFIQNTLSLQDPVNNETAADVWIFGIGICQILTSTTSCFVHMVMQIPVLRKYPTLIWIYCKITKKSSKRCLHF